MYAADTAGGKHGNARGVREYERCSHGGRAVGMRGGRRCDVARRHFAHAIAGEESLEIIAIKSDERYTSRDCGDRGLGSSRTRLSQHASRGVAVFRLGQALREHRALEGDDGPAVA